MGLLNFFTGGKSGKAAKLAGQAVDALRGVDIPELHKQRLVLELLVSQGELTPEQADTISAQDSSLGAYSADPRLRQAQLNALGEMERAGAEGYTAQDRAAMGAIMGDINARERGSREAIRASMAARGMSNSGLELLAQLSNQQAGAQRGSMEGLNLAAASRERALNALLQAGQLGGGIRQQDFSEAARKAEAQDIINRFNAANSQQVLNQNVLARNQAMAANLAKRQGIADQNVALKNQQQAYNKGLYQQQFQNQMQKQGAVANALMGQANLAQQQGNQAIGLGFGLFQAAKEIPGMVKGAAGMFKNEEPSGGTWV